MNTIDKNRLETFLGQSKILLERWKIENSLVAIIYCYIIEKDISWYNLKKTSVEERVIDLYNDEFVGNFIEQWAWFKDLQDFENYMIEKVWKNLFLEL